MPRLYTLDNQFIKETFLRPNNFTGIVEYTTGGRYWFTDGKLHRTDGPAVESPSKFKEWYFEGKIHRVDGPAIEYKNDYKEYWINGTQIKNCTQESFVLLCDIFKLKNMGVI